jgi:cell fate regulator YaaT (PSP1 superfamily)
MSTQYLVRYGSAAQLGRFEGPEASAFVRDEPVVVQTERGAEIGTVLSPVRGAGSGGDTGAGVLRILRPATDDDLAVAAARIRETADLFERCRLFFQRRNARLQLVDAEQLFDGEHIVLHVIRESDEPAEPELIAALRILLGKSVELHRASADHPGFLPAYHPAASCGRCDCGTTAG